MDLADHIFLKRVRGAKPEWIAEVLGRLVWLTDDNGSEICRTLRTWLAGDDEEQVAVALEFDELVLWKSASDMEEELTRIQTQFPSLAAKCVEARAEWFKQFPSGVTT